MFETGFQPSRVRASDDLGRRSSRSLDGRSRSNAGLASSVRIPRARKPTTAPPLVTASLPPQILPARARYTFAPGAHPQRQVLRPPAVPSPGVYGLDSPRGILDLQHQRHPGRLRRPPGGSRRRRDTRLLHPPHGRGRGDAVGPRHLRDDGELLAGGRPRRRGGAAGDARVGGQAGGQAEVRGVVDAKGLPVDRSARRIP